MVLKEEIIELEYAPEGKKEKEKLQLKKVCYQDEKNLYYEFITNHFESTAGEIASYIGSDGELNCCLKK